MPKSPVWRGGGEDKMQDRENKIILVTGATGKQGGAVVEHLLRENWKVRALCRDPGKEEARILEHQGVEIIRGNLDEPQTLRHACADCHGVFGVQNFWETGAERETRQGIALAEAVRDAGVRHFIYSSVGGAERGTGIPHFDSKWRIELRIEEMKLPVTILRPVFFMENFNLPDFRDSITSGVLRMPLRKDRKLQTIAVTDVGAFVAIAFADPDRYLGQALELGGDEVTGPQAAEAFSEVLGSPVRYEEVPVQAAIDQNPEWGVMFKWFNEQGYQADIRGLRRIHPSMLPFSTWVATSWIKVAAMSR